MTRLYGIFKGFIWFFTGTKKMVAFTITDHTSFYRSVTYGYRKHGIGSVYLYTILIYALKKLSDLIIKSWIKWGIILNRIFSPMILGVVYFVFLSPIALLYRCVKRKKKVTDTTFNRREKMFLKEDFKHPW